MRILLDHNTPQGLRALLPEHEVHSAAFRGWERLRNGNLLETATAEGYEILITCDQGISYQQNLELYGPIVLTIMSNNWPAIRENIELIRQAIPEAVHGQGNLLYFPADK